MSVLTRVSVFLIPVSLVMWYPHSSAIAAELRSIIAQEKVESIQKLVAQSSTSVVVDRPILKKGSKGKEVSELQAALKLLGYYKGEVDGVYNDNTASAVSQFQQAAGLNPDGIVDRETWQKLFPQTPSSANNSQLANSPKPEITPATSEKQSTTEEPTTDSNNTQTSETPTVNLPTLKLGMQSPEVFWLQKRLQAIGFFQGSVDGIFGKDTQTAVIAAQKKYGLKPDGIVGAATWQAILP
ncbi:peptidoglycan-binding domain-containing protein [[Phormidium ambiguum] IAM M-71]|nr:peptidoglycan-binding protein [Phormidium ambiguum]